MKIAAINGSPKSNGVSALLIQQMEKLAGTKIETYHAIQLARSGLPQETMAEILSADALLIVSPLYVDSLPAPLIATLTSLENAAQNKAGRPQVFAIINGAFDAPQTKLALDMVQHFATHAGLPWGCGMGIGKGIMLGIFHDNWATGPTCEVQQALLAMAEAIQNKASVPHAYPPIKVPVFLYKLLVNIFFTLQAKQNKAGKLNAKPYTTD